MGWLIRNMLTLRYWGAVLNFLMVPVMAYIWHATGSWFALILGAAHCAIGAAVILTGRGLDKAIHRLRQSTGEEIEA